MPINLNYGVRFLRNEKFKLQTFLIKLYIWPLFYTMSWILLYINFELSYYFFSVSRHMCRTILTFLFYFNQESVAHSRTLPSFHCKHCLWLRAPKPTTNMTWEHWNNFNHCFAYPILSLVLPWILLVFALSGDISGWSGLPSVSIAASKLHVFFICVVGRIRRSAPKILGPWCTHTFSQLFNQPLILVGILQN